VEFYVVTNSIEPFFRSYLSDAHSLEASLIVATTWIFSPVYGWLSDSRFGHYPVLVASLATYIVGGGLVCGSALTLDGSHHAATQGLYYSGLCLIALVGAPGIRAVAVPFMLEQLTAEAEQRYTYLTTFVTWSYFFINVGAEIGLLLGGYLQSRRGPFISSEKQELTGFFWRYLLGFVSLLIAMCLLYLWKKKFRQYQPHITSKPNIPAIFKAACCTKPKRQHFDSDRLRQYEREPADEEQRKNKKYQEDTQRLANLVPFMFTMIIYFLTNSQTETSFAVQGLRMNFSNPFNQSILPEDWTNAFDPIGVIITVPFMLYIVKPSYERLTRRQMTMLPRIRWGMILSASACALASVIESIRLHCCLFGKEAFHVHGHTVHYCYSGLSIYTQVPQYVIIGVSEVLATVGFMEFVLSTSPREFRCTTFGILQMMQGIARYIGVGLLYIIKAINSSWYYLPHHRNNQETTCSIHHDRHSSPYMYFVILTLLMIANIIIYIIVEFRYKKYIRIAPLQRNWTASN
jgi:peptide/histidine transporter 3/4